MQAAIVDCPRHPESGEGALHNLEGDGVRELVDSKRPARRGGGGNKTANFDVIGSDPMARAAQF